MKNFYFLCRDGGKAISYNKVYNKYKYEYKNKTQRGNTI